MRRLGLLLLCTAACSAERIDAVTPFERGGGPNGHFQMEALDRGLVAVEVPGGVYVGWRMFGYEYDPNAQAIIAYTVYRDGHRIAQVTDSTNYLDPAGRSGSSYSVRPVLAGVEGADSGQVSVWPENYLRIPLDIPPAGVTPGAPTCDPPSEGYTYDVGDGSVGDLDGDGRYELVLKWDPQNLKDNAVSGCTGNVYLDAYEIDGAQGRLWRIDLGPNIRAGAHYTQFLVYDFDGDGKAEVVMKTAPGTRDGKGALLHTGPAATDDDAADYRSVGNASGTTGYILTGPEYLTVFDGATGAELATANFEPARGELASWGDGYGNRADIFTASAGFVSDLGSGKAASGRPSILMARGGFGRAAVAAWTWRDGRLDMLWKADSDAGTAFAMQGAHSLAVADVDGDGAQEIIFGGTTIGSDGSAMCSTSGGPGHALQVGDFVPSRPGLEVFMTHQGNDTPSFDLRDARTCAVLLAGPVVADGARRGLAEDVSGTSEGAELWADSSGGVRSATTGLVVDENAKPPMNFLIYWEAGNQRALEDGIAITRYGGEVLQSCQSCASIDGPRATPVLTADLLGDWREEIIWREIGNAALRIYTTTQLTQRRLYTFMHEPQYRMQVSAEQTGFNQPPHLGFDFGDGMILPPKPDIQVR
jgi:hypothetical protein